MRKFENSLWIPKTVEEVFPFFADAKNLEAITPPWLNFRILSQSTAEIGEGTVFNYKLKIKGIPVRWTSRIEEWSPNARFVDRQLRGPYKHWHHTHLFQSENSGTRMTDIVLYELPLGWLGNVALGAYVDSDVRKIFGYREQVIRDVFGIDNHSQ